MKFLSKKFIVKSNICLILSLLLSTELNAKELPSEDITINYDNYGVAHIFAKNTEDLLFGQGYVAAKDRLWQMDYLRRQAHGQLSELFGEKTYAEDLFSRAMQFSILANNAYEDLSQNDNDTKLAIDAYTQGVNAYIDEAISGINGETLPPQIIALGYIPQKWTPQDTLAIDRAVAYGFSATHLTDLTVWIVSQLLSDEVSNDIIRAQPADRSYIVPNFYDDLISNKLKKKDLKNKTKKANKLDDFYEKALSKIKREDLIKSLEKIKEQKFMGNFAGSNNWVISGDLTESGYPLLANDTHAEVGQPSLYHEVHLNTEEYGGNWNIAGYGIAGLPSVLLGHNQTSAWGLTLNYADVSDVFLEKAISNFVSYDGKWVKMESRNENILVRQEGGSVEDAIPYKEVLQTVPHHGPVIPKSLLGDLPLTLSAVWTGFTTSSLTKMLLMLPDTHSFEDMQQALQHLTAGSVNAVYADIYGTIAYSSRADIPIRKTLDPDHPPYMVMPGTGGYEFSGKILPDNLIPWVKNPEKGFITSSNNDPVGATDDNDPLNGPYVDSIESNIYLGAIYDQGNRAYRLDELITSATKNALVNRETMKTWQADVSSRFTKQYIPYLLDAANRRPDLLSDQDIVGIDILRNFDATNYNCSIDSYGCVLAHAFIPYLFSDILSDETDPALFSTLNRSYLNMMSRPVSYFLLETKDIVDALDYQASGACKIHRKNPYCQVEFPSNSGTNYFDNQDTKDKIETRDEVLIGAFKTAVNIITERYGSLSAHSWGDFHTLTLNDPANINNDYQDTTSDPYPNDGAVFTVDVSDATISKNGELVTEMDAEIGACQRTVYELTPEGIITESILPGGQSERVDSVFFNDQFDLYIQNKYRVLPFTTESVYSNIYSTKVIPAVLANSSSKVITSKVKTVK